MVVPNIMAANTALMSYMNSFFQSDRELGNIPACMKAGIPLTCITGVAAAAHPEEAADISLWERPYISAVIPLLSCPDGTQLAGVEEGSTCKHSPSPWTLLSACMCEYVLCMYVYLFRSLMGLPEYEVQEK